MRIDIKRRTGLVALAVVIVGAMGLYEQLGSMNANLGGHSNEAIWSGLSCRARLYLRKARGEIPGVSWTDLWQMTRLSRGFYCVEGSGLAADLQYSSVASEDDREEGAKIFHGRCTACHGGDASGGPFAPSLVKSQLKAGDSDLAIYQVLRKGYPGRLCGRSICRRANC